MSHIQRRGKDRWRARYLDPEGRERSKTFTRRIDAERFLATVDADLVRGEWIDPRLGQKTFGQWVEEFESSRVDLEATTRAQHAACLRNHLLPCFGNKRLAAITEMQVRGFVTELVNQNLAASTVTKSLRILSQILKAAVRNRLIPSNPCEGVEGPGEAPVEETIFLGPEEVNAVADAVAERFGPPKYGRVRSVPLPPFLVEELAGHLARFPPTSDLVFTSPEGALLRRSNFN